VDALTALTGLARTEAAATAAAPPAEDPVREPADTVTDMPVAQVNGTRPADDPAGPDGLSARSLTDVATSLWRLRTRMAESDDAPRAVVRHLETAWDALSDAGVEIKDHVGDPFDPGLMMSVVAYQPTPGLRREQIIEAIRPSVYLGERQIQTAEVIVGTPEPPEMPAAGVEETRTR
jgi:hypothetical protein